MTHRRLAAQILLAAGGVALLYGLYLPAKAEMAQILLCRAWHLRSSGPVRPWPWCSTWPVARLRVPSLGIDQIVLAGDEGASLAFAPGHVESTASPGSAGHVGIAGHRDTVFRFLGRLRVGDFIWLEGREGARRCYRVDRTEVIHESDTWILQPTNDPQLTLITCYPLDATHPGGPLRYIVRAQGAEAQAGYGAETTELDGAKANVRLHPFPNPNLFVPITYTSPRGNHATRVFETVLSRDSCGERRWHVPAIAEHGPRRNRPSRYGRNAP